MCGRKMRYGEDRIKYKPIKGGLGQAGINYLWGLPAVWNTQKICHLYTRGGKIGGHLVLLGGTIQDHNQIDNILTIYQGLRLSSGLCLSDTTRSWKALPG